MADKWRVTEVHPRDGGVYRVEIDRGRGWRPADVEEVRCALMQQMLPFPRSGKPALDMNPPPRQPLMDLDGGAAAD